MYLLDSSNDDAWYMDFRISMHLSCKHEWLKNFKKILAMGFNIDFGNNSIQEVVLNKRKAMVSLKIGERKYMPFRPTCFTSTISLINDETFMK
jgi:hypothetical protein